MKKIKLNTTALLSPFKYHNQIKGELISKINKSYNDNLSNHNEYYDDEIHRLDWSQNKDFNREWVKFVKPKIQEHFNECALKIGLQNAVIKDIWYQQYIKNNTHGWHTHGENYTGVYYLEFPKGSPKTELIDQSNLNKKISINAKEGDIVIFPSFIIHRAPRVIQDVKKTIISFNLYLEFIDPDILETLNNL